MSELQDDSIDCIVTSPPYNKTGITGKTNLKIGNQIWNKFNIDYNFYNDNMPEDKYQDWMVSVLNEMHRIIKPNGSIFFNHKPRRFNNKCFLPTDFICKPKVSFAPLNLSKFHLGTFTIT